jgi:hypothetical protein
MQAVRAFIVTAKSAHYSATGSEECHVKGSEKAKVRNVLNHQHHQHIWQRLGHLS